VQIDFVIDAAMKNIEMASGGPFAAGVFEIHSGELIALGVNLVTTEKLSILHAELVAISIAQRQLGSYDLATSEHAAYSLVISAEPCAMCLGAIPWSGISRVVTAAADEDARAAGFDEGSKPADWINALTSRGISVAIGVHRERAAEVLSQYKINHGHIYNSKGI
ncbi:MAG: nucleoside deaminase, partial [Spongiibacteraceae bacterium]